MRTAAIIPVAGLSSRMGGFKPLMALNGFEMIRLTVQGMLDGGVDDIFVVVGREHEQIEEALRNTSFPGKSMPQGVVPLTTSGTPPYSNVHCVENPAFATTDMLYSVQCALKMLAEYETTVTNQAFDMAYIIPGDIPAFSPRTVVALCGQAARSTAAVICPAVRMDTEKMAEQMAGQTGRPTAGLSTEQANEKTAEQTTRQPEIPLKKGHPLLIKRECFAAITAFTAQGGLKQALAPFALELLEVDDEGILLDADDPLTFARLEAYVRAHKGVSDKEAKALLDRFGTLPNIRAHCEAVAALTTRMAQSLNVHGFGLDLTLSRSAALIHDINRLEKNHAAVAAVNLCALGYDALAEVVGKHNDSLILGEGDTMLNEANIVFVVDKMVRETELVSIDERYALALEEFPESTAIGKRARHDVESCKTLLSRYVEITGDKLYER